MCFFAGANSVFYGDKLLTAANPAARQDLALLQALDLRPRTLPVAAAVMEENEPVDTAQKYSLGNGRNPLTKPAPNQQSVPRMKKLFPLLLSYVLMATQCYAISGGPGTVGGNSGSVDVVGAYSGVIIGTTELDSTTSPTIPGDATGISVGGSTASSALGLFDLTVPRRQYRHGCFFTVRLGPGLHRDHFRFGGTPTPASYRACCKARTISASAWKMATGAVVQVPISATADGLINANIRATSSSSNTTARLTGTAALEISFGGVDPNTFAPIISQTIMFKCLGLPANDRRHGGQCRQHDRQPDRCQRCGWRERLACVDDGTVSEAICFFLSVSLGGDQPRPCLLFGADVG